MAVTQLPDQESGLQPPFKEAVEYTDFERPHQEGVFISPHNLYEYVRGVGEAVVHNTFDNIRIFGHELMHGSYSEKFCREFDDRRCFETTDGIPMTARILNPEFLDPNNPLSDDKVIVYSYSLAVPAAHGVELPTLAALAAHGEETGRAVIAITTEGLSGPLSTEQLRSLSDFWNLAKRRFEVLRQIFPDGKKIMVTGASLGGMISHAMARTWQKEARESGVDIEVTHDFAVASSGHFEFSPKYYPRLIRQLVRESKGSIEYLASGDGVKGKVQRGFEFVGTINMHPSQWLAIAAIAMSIKEAPLRDIHNNIPYDIDVRDYTFSEDELAHAKRRLYLAASSRHPHYTHEQDPGYHLALLTKGKEWTLRQFESIISERGIGVAQTTF